MRTKWQVLEARAAALEAEAATIRANLASLAELKFGGDCTYCGAHLETEEDFAKHYVLPNEKYLNTGECPRMIAGDKRITLPPRTYQDVLGPMKDILHPEGI